MIKVLEKRKGQFNYVLVELTTISNDTFVQFEIDLNQVYEFFTGSLNANTGMTRVDIQKRVRPVVKNFLKKRNTFETEDSCLNLRCYTEPQIERGYQAMLELWQAIKTAATTTPPRRLVAENKLKELFK